MALRLLIGHVLDQVAALWRAKRWLARAPSVGTKWQVVGRESRDVPHVEGEMRQAAMDILAALVEPRQRMAGEPVAKVVDTRSRALPVPHAGLLEQPRGAVAKPRPV